MSATYALFERWKAAKGFPTITAASTALRLHQTAVTHWKNGRNGSAAVIERMAKDLGEDPVPVILQAFAEAARDAEDKRTLGRLARRLGAACVALLALAPWTLPSNAYAAGQGHVETTSLYIMRNVREAARALLRRWRSLIAPRLQPRHMEPYAWNRFASSPASP